MSDIFRETASATRRVKNYTPHEVFKLRKTVRKIFGITDTEDKVQTYILARVTAEELEAWYNDFGKEELEAWYNNDFGKFVKD